MLEEVVENNLKGVRRWFREVWNEGREETIDEMLDAQTAVHGLTGGALGFAEFKHFWNAMNETFDDLWVDVQEAIGARDLTACRFTVTATHAGRGLGVAPTHLPVAFSGQTITKWRDGRIVEGWNTLDMAAVYQQIGALTV